MRHEGEYKQTLNNFTFKDTNLEEIASLSNQPLLDG